MSHLLVGTALPFYVAALPFKYIFLLDLIGPLRTMHALSVGEVYYVLKSGLIQSFHT